MKVTMFWHGGANYAMFDTSSPKDAEEFESLAAAKAEFAHRASGDDSYYPCVEGSTAWIFLGEAKEAIGRDYPDKIFSQGPRGGIVCTNA